MKTVVVILALILAAQGHTAQKRDAKMEPYESKCVFCNEDPGVTKDYSECLDLQDEMDKEHYEKCHKEATGAESLTEQFKVLCKSDNNEYKKFLECQEKNSEHVTPSEEHLKKDKEVNACMTKVLMTYCTELPFITPSSL